jgi:hypothetical protein
VLAMCEGALVRIVTPRGGTERVKDELCRKPQFAVCAKNQLLVVSLVVDDIPSSQT